MFAKKKPIANFSNNPNCMDSLYEFHDELGSGGFGKVKLATHLLTGEKVAIKIIDKKAIGDDLPRVTTELEALKHLAHQNICRLFQYVETVDKFYIYCNGGEMFDYIVKKERLEESEARHFFVNWDLKPENLLLKEDLQLKVIDFGLCAKPRNGLNRTLETCCGSPAYAAPELIQSSAYFGNEADVWSMGVLLYALLCGALPFEDDTRVYYEPSFLSEQSKELLRELLRVNPKYRITVKQLLAHPWLNKNYNQTLKWKSIYDTNLIDEDIAREIAFYHRDGYLSRASTEKERKQPFVLPSYRSRVDNIIYSPTIHASLEQDLNRYGYDKVEKEHSKQELRESHRLWFAFCIVRSPLQIKCPAKTLNKEDAAVKALYPETPSISKSIGNKICTNKENQRPATLRARGPMNIIPSNRTDESRPVSVYNTPRRTPFNGVFSPASYRRPKSTERDHPGAVNSSPVSNRSPVTPTAGGASERMPRSQVKTSRLRTRVFKSLERNKDRVMNLLTPRKMKNEGPTMLKSVRNMVNISITSSTDPNQVRFELLRVLANQESLQCRMDGKFLAPREVLPVDKQRSSWK
uniref:Protein kinase domain-containing protein n=1 Tax=Ditylenchus dipsaci TaxID=166011 RepID=A0A915DQA0_9BILA